MRATQLTKRTTPPQSVLDFQLSALELLPDVPELKGVLTPPSHTVVANVTVTVFLFNDLNATAPYAYAYEVPTLNSDEPTVIDLNNGQQAFPPKTLKKVEIVLLFKRPPL